MRECGDCTLCCRLLPVKEIGKLANERCAHQRHTGCKIYGLGNGMPFACKMWNCRWIVSDDTADQKRPDRSRIVIDMMPDFVTVIDNDTGNQMQIEVVQCWIDPRFPDAHRDPTFRAYVERQAALGKLALIRYDAKKAFTLIAPSFNSDGEWHEVWSENAGEATHTPEQIMRAIGGGNAV